MSLTNRSAVWIAISELYLDTELEESDYARIASIIFENKFSIAEAKRIDRDEVFPILQWNLFSAAGVWSAFDEKWLVDRISHSIQNKSRLKQLLLGIFYFAFSWMHVNSWQRLAQAYDHVRK